MATTSATPVAPINFTSSLPAMMELLKYAGGTKTTQSEGGTQTTTSAQDQVATTTGQTGPLEAILAQLSDPNNLKNLVESLFAQGAQQVPTLATAYANSTGTRVSNNTMLSSSLAQLNQTLAQSIANAVVQQQQTAVTAAGKLAETNKTQATKSTGTQETAKNLTTTSVVQPNVSPVKSLGLPTLAGTLLNQLGKQMRPAGASAPTAGAPISMASGASIDVANQNFDYPDAFSQAQHAIASPMVVPAENIPMLPQVFAPSAALGASGGADFLATATSNVDGGEFVGGIDELFTAGGGSDFVGDLPLDEAVAGGGSFLDDLLGGIGEFFGGWADGGRVRGRRKGYADGGLVEGERTPVIRNIADFGPRRKVNGRDALNYGPAGAGGGTGIPSTSVPAGAPAGGGAGGDFQSLLSSESSGPGDVEANPNPSSLAISPMQALSLLTAVLAPSPMSIANAISIATTGQGLFTNAVNAVTGSVAISVPESQPDPATGMDTAPAPDPVGSVSISVPGDTEGDTADADEGGTPGGVGDAGTDEGGTGTGTGDASGDAGDAGSGDAFVDGGPVKGKKKGIDQVPIMATADEYVLPVDVVKFIGKDNLDELVAMIHTPIRGGTRA